MGKTEILLNIIGYFVDYDPSPILLLQPTLEMAQTFSKDRLAPMLRDTPALRGKVSDSKSKTSGNTMLHKTFPGGHITMAGANSPASLASRPIRILLADEVDRYPVSAGTEGDPVKLAEKRTTTFWNRKKVKVSTPTIAGQSRIEMDYEDSTQEIYCLPCPSCGDLQQIKRACLVHTYDDDELKKVDATCESCGSVHSESEWKSSEGEWVARARHSKTRGFHLNEYISPWRRWLDIEVDFLQAKKSPETLKTFVNTSLGETWEEEGETIEHETLYNRREHYPAKVPREACVLTAAVDVQDDRLEIGVEGWAVGEENWKIDFQILRGDPARPNLWKKLDEVLSTRYLHESGVELPIACTTIDSGGHYTQEVYKFVKGKAARRVYAIKGKSQAGAPIVGRPSKSNLGKVDLYTIGTDTAKEIIYARLKNMEPGAGYIHFPVDRLFDEEYFLQLTAEKCIKKYIKGVATKVWEKKRPRNEALDLAVYNIAALLILNPSYKALAARLEEPEPEPEPEERNTLKKRRPKARKRNWATDI